MEFNKVKRNPSRGVYQEEWILDLLDQHAVIHVAISTDKGPLILPMAFGREGETIFLHGAISNHLLKSMDPEQNIALCLTAYDGLVLAKSVFHHSMNYRSVVLFGKPRLLEDDEKMNALEVITEHLCKGRWDEARKPSDEEFKATRVIAVKIDSASGKMRSGPPSDDEADKDLDVWNGNISYEGSYKEVEHPSSEDLPESVKRILKSK